MSALNCTVYICYIVCFYHNIVLGVLHDIQSPAITANNQALLSNVQKRQSMAPSKQHNLMVLLEHILLT